MPLDKAKLEKVLSPCEKNTASLEEIMVNCSGCYPIVIAQKFGTKDAGTPGFLGVSDSVNKKELHCCIFQSTTTLQPKLKLVVRFAITGRSVAQLRGLMKVVESEAIATKH